MREWPSNPAYEAAVDRIHAGEREAALPLFEGALGAQPDRPRIHANRALNLMELGRLDEARAAAQRGCDLADPDDPYPEQALVSVLERGGDGDGALRVIDQALARAVGNPLQRVDVQVRRARLLFDLGRDREAIAEARDAARTSPERNDVQLILARSLGSANRWGEASRLVDAVLAIDPTDEDAVELRGIIARGLAIAEDMVTTARAELAKAPSRCEAWLELGMALTMVGRLAEAAEAFDRAHEHNPEPDGWPAEPHMLSVWEADCRLALLSENPPRPPSARPDTA